jgi:hypothetical protein
MQMTGLKQRVGIEGFFCMVRTATNFHMAPQWYFTSVGLHDYMKIAVRRRWDTAEVGTKLEAFSIAGCDVISKLFVYYSSRGGMYCSLSADLLNSSKKKADHMKGQIRDMINEKLGRFLSVRVGPLLILFYIIIVKITGQSNAVMQYLNYERDTVLRHGVVLEGWTHSTWANPSELSTSLEPLRKLLDALKNDTCKFVKLTSEQRQKRQEAYNKKVDSGEIQVQRQKRKDAGKKRKQQDDAGSESDGSEDVDNVVRRNDDRGDDGPSVQSKKGKARQGTTAKRSRAGGQEDEDHTQPRKRRRRSSKKSAPVVNDHDDDDDDIEG